MKKNILLLGYLIGFWSIINLHAQHEPLTLSQGVYPEAFEQNEVVEVGPIVLDAEFNLLALRTVECEAEVLSHSRFLSIDPLVNSYPMLTPYQFASNRPIDGIDLEGLEYISAKDLQNIGRYDPEFAKLTASDVNAITYKDQTFYRVGRHMYQGDNGQVSTNPAGQQVTQWIFSQIDPVLAADQNENIVDNCFTAACGTAANGGWVSGGSNYWSTDYQFQLFSGTNSPAVDYDESRPLGLDQIHNALDNLSQPIVVGVDYNPSSNANPQTDGTTDHFITIVGRGTDDHGDYFRYFENVPGGTSQTGDELRLYLQGNNTLQSRDDGNGGSTYTFNERKFTITQVRPSAE